MTRRPAVALTLAALCAMAAAAIGRGAWTDAIAAARAEERAATMADVQAQLAASWGAQWRAMTAGADAAPSSIQQATPEAVAEPSRWRCEDVPASVMPATVRAFCAEINAAADAWAMDPRAMALVVIQECPWADAACESPMGAQGLAQVMAPTAVTIEAETGLPCTAGPKGVNLDPAVNLACGAYYYAKALKAAATIWQAGDEASHVGAAGIGYNAGVGRVPAAVAHWQAGGHVCDSPVPAESRRWCRMAYDGWQLMVASPALPSVELGIAYRSAP